MTIIILLPNAKVGNLRKRLNLDSENICDIRGNINNLHKQDAMSKFKFIVGKLNISVPI